MSITTYTSREFNQDTSRAKAAARNGPVFITDRGRAAHVLLTIEDYEKLSGDHESIVELLSLPAEVGDIDLPVPRPRDRAQPADLD